MSYEKITDNLIIARNLNDEQVLIPLNKILFCEVPTDTTSRIYFSNQCVIQIKISLYEMSNLMKEMF